MIKPGMLISQSLNMKKVAIFEVNGAPPIPWKTPQVFMKKSNRTGKSWKSSAKDKALTFWQAYVGEHAKDAMNGAGVATGPLFAKLEFTTRTPDEGKHGRLVAQQVKFNADKRDYVKVGKAVPDIDNLVKAALDGMQGIVFANDAQVCVLSSSRRYGPADGVRVCIWEFLESDDTAVV